MVKEILKQKAIKLRKEGKTYSEIMKVVPVAKSTVSLWLREVGLSISQKQLITEKRRQGQIKGAQAQRNKRIKKQINIINSAEAMIGKLSLRELWLIGIALYWAEGSKEKENYPGIGVSFSNSDPRMILVFLEWLKKCVMVSDKQIITSLYIHESNKYRIDEVVNKWRKILNKPRSFFKYIYYKKNKIKTNRTNKGDLYIGLLRVNISASSDLNRKITGWTKGITNNCGIV